MESSCERGSRVELEMAYSLTEWQANWEDWVIGACGEYGLIDMRLLQRFEAKVNKGARLFYIDRGLR